MKKFLAILLSVMLVMTFGLMAFATGDDPGSGSGSTPSYTITVTNAVEGETYSAYKIFDAAGTVSGGVFEAPTGDAATYNEAEHVTYYKQVTDSTYSGAVTYEKLTADEISALSEDQSMASYYVLKSGVSYTIPATINNATNPWYTVVSNYANAADTTDADGLTLTPSAGDPNVYVVSIDESKFDAKAFAQALKTALDASPSTYAPAADSDTAGSSALTLDVGAPGYYFVDTSLGSLCALDTASTSATVYEKNSEPTLNKQISDDGTTYGAGPVDVDMGDTVYYKITVTDGIGTDTAITVHDVMEAGLTLDPSSFAVKVNDTDVAATNYSIVVNSSAKVTEAVASPVTSAAIQDGDTFEVVLNAAYVNSLPEGAQVVITYEAVLNAAAEIYYGDSTGLNNTNDNTAHLTYSQQSSTDVTVQAKTYEYELIKTDNATPAAPLEGVKFTLTKTESGTTYYYTPAADTTTSGATTTSTVWGTTSNELVTGQDGTIVFTGLDAGTYILTETETVDGYNLLTNTITVIIAPDGTVTARNTSDSSTIDVTPAAKSGSNVTPANFNIINSQGSLLPSTGGIGTTILYIVGAILVLGAGILIIAKRRSAAAEQ